MALNNLQRVDMPLNKETKPGHSFLRVPGLIPVVRIFFLDFFPSKNIENTIS